VRLILIGPVYPCVPVGPGGRLEIAEDKSGDSGLRVVYYAPDDGRLRVVALFLPGRWAGVEAGWEREGLALWIAQREQRIVLPLSEGR